MDVHEESFLGFFKYEGELVKDGYLDLRKSSEVLTGIDEALRYFIYQTNPALLSTPFEIPVRVRKGSWETLIPHTLAEWVIKGGAAILTTYGITAAKKMAENDFKDKGVKDVLKESIKAMKWVVKIAIHLGSMVKKEFGKVEFKEMEGQQLVGIANELDQWIYVPQKYIQYYVNCPEKLFSKLTKNIEVERELEIGFSENEPEDNDDTNRVIRIGLSNKFIFTKNQDDSYILFPELVHAQYVELEGRVTRGNENSNTIGFEYEKHILTCSPADGNITEYKNILFTNCTIKGYVDRVGNDGNINEKRPKIRFVELIKILDKGDQLNLFEKK